MKSLLIINEYNAKFSSKRKDNGIIIVRGVECDYSGIKYHFKFGARDIVSKYEV